MNIARDGGETTPGSSVGAGHRRGFEWQCSGREPCGGWSGRQCWFVRGRQLGAVGRGPCRARVGRYRAVDAGLGGWRGFAGTGPRGRRAAFSTFRMLVIVGPVENAATPGMVIGRLAVVADGGARCHRFQEAPALSCALKSSLGRSGARTVQQRFQGVAESRRPWPPRSRSCRPTPTVLVFAHTLSGRGGYRMAKPAIPVTFGRSRMAGFLGHGVESMTWVDGSS